MNIKDLKPLRDEECQAIDGGFWPVLLLGASILVTAIPMIKSMWNSNSGSFSLPGGAGAKWGDEKTQAKGGEGTDLKKVVANLENKIQHLIPPFYEF